MSGLLGAALVAGGERLELTDSDLFEIAVAVSERLSGLKCIKPESVARESGVDAETIAAEIDDEIARVMRVYRWIEDRVNDHTRAGR